MVFVTIKHTPDPTKFEKERQSSLLSTTSRTADASYPSIGNSSRDLDSGKRLRSPKYHSKQDSNSQQSSQSNSRQDSQQSQNSKLKVNSRASNGYLYVEEADFTLDDEQIVELSHIISRKRPNYQPISPTSTRQLPRDDLITGRIINFGGFGMVRKVKSSVLKEMTSRPCVMKTCKPSSVHNIVSGVTHLMRERYFLSHLKHPHIVRMVAASEHKDPFEAIFQSKRIDSCFLILEYLPETLHDRIHSWKKRRQELTKKDKTVSWNRIRGNQSHRGDPGLSLCSQADKDMFAEQLVVALEVASALQYLHSQRVIFRDLKPSNVGIDVHGKAKIFDFGLATQLASKANLDTTYALPGRVGTTRYMASEVLRNDPYNVKADVFSYSLLLWEIVALERPHENMPGAAVYGDRPSIPKSWPAELRRILERGWSEDLSERPHIREMTYVLLDLLRRVQS